MQELLNGVAQGTVYALIAAGLVLIFGVVRVPHFAHGESVMVSGMMTCWAVTSLHLPVLLGAAVGVAASVGYGLFLCFAVYWPMRNHPEWNLLASSLGAVVITQTAAIAIWTSTPRVTPGGVSGSFEIGDAIIPWSWAVLAAISAAVIGATALLVSRTTAGVSMKAMAADAETAQLMGIPVRKNWAIAFAVGSALAGVAGSVYSTVFPVSTTLGLDVTFSALVVIILAGIGSVAHVLWGGVLLGVVEAVAGTVFPGGYQDSMVFLFMLVVLVARPNGLFGLERARD
ncbi:branched-chain amino acid ABC transporter permease [Nocardioides marmoriginsengisoli]|uniref:Branched-chain amino acid ABC transporter permease n=1 Tax=Nocardioides marmoriginsengisoli TaxID=661483 RepID=A0A3N0CGA2_9ACTN|nr:branched-chain amino acid ABC transporter permease [Nocardioides marmoriginsengisoli]RNL62465.1 branched-chain amino acid ABC transporter permease [Nocardioides marmoriginsengisoli]